MTTLKLLRLYLQSTQDYPLSKTKTEYINFLWTSLKEVFFFPPPPFFLNRLVCHSTKLVCHSTKPACFTVVIRTTNFPVIATALVELQRFC